jgi:small-conductance mechanosensitive channel
MKILEWIYGLIGVTPAVQKKVALSLLTVILLYLVGKVVIKLLRRIKDSISRYELIKATAILLVFIGGLCIGRIWFLWFESWIIFLGLILGAGLLALKEVLFAVAGWVYLVWRRPFEAGDWVAVGENAGEVLEINHVQFSLLETSGCDVGKLRSGLIVRIPNSKIFSEKMINYSKGYHYIWNEFAVPITLESDWRQAKEMLLRIVNRYTEVVNQNNDPLIQKVAERCTVFYHKLTPEIYTQVNDGRIILTVRFLCEPDKRRITMHAIWEDILQEFRWNENFQLVYSQLCDLPDRYEIINNGSADGRFPLKGGL